MAASVTSATQRFKRRGLNVQQKTNIRIAKEALLRGINRTNQTKRVSTMSDDNIARMRPRLVLFKEGCRYLGYGKSKAYALIAEGKIKAFRMGSKTMLDLDSIDQYHASLPQLEPGEVGEIKSS